LPDLRIIAELDLPAIKIASPDLVNMLLLDHACQTGLPLLISTGASTLDEVKSAIAWLECRTEDYVMMHCVSSYPTAPDDAYLNWVGDLQDFGVVAGYSDHTDQIIAGALAAAHGARVIEKHLTHDIAASGPDHSASFEPETFAKYVSHIRLAERMQRGSYRHVLECEKDVRTVSRQGLVLKRDVVGRAIARDDLTTQRPGPGVPESLLKTMIGAAPLRPLKAGQFVTENDLA
jgi:sialic acid synthase SpsE